MDRKEYIRKREAIAASSAAISVKVKAMTELEEQYIGIRNKAMKLILESAPDIPKGD